MIDPVMIFVACGVVAAAWAVIWIVRRFLKG